MEKETKNLKNQLHNKNLSQSPIKSLNNNNNINEDKKYNKDIKKDKEMEGLKIKNKCLKIENDAMTEELYSYVSKYNDVNKFIVNKLATSKTKIVDLNDPIKNFNHQIES